MGDSLLTTILSAEVEFIERRLVSPLRLSSGPIHELTEARATVFVRVGEREAIGKGSIYLSDLWAWPDPAITHERRNQLLRETCTDLASNLANLCGGEAAHPLVLGLRLHHSLTSRKWPGHPPVLALAMAASPFDAAVHDGAGRAADQSAFAFYSGAPKDAPFEEADAYFAGRDARAAIRRMLTAPRSDLPAWSIIGKDDALDGIRDRWHRAHGYERFKLKITGDTRADLARTIEVFRAAKAWGIARPHLSLDSNEANPDAASVLDFLERLRAEDAEAFAALDYLEQPTSRDIVGSRQDRSAVARLKPVMLDEGLTNLELLDEAVEQGWSGLALKTCKGHSFALVAAAWAHERGLLLSIQDLTNPGLAGIHSALFAAHVTTINGVELNSPQFTPEANEDWLPRLAGLFDPREGVHRIPMPPPAGLGSGL